MVRHLLAIIRGRRPRTSEDLAAREEAKRLQEDMLTIRVLDRSGPRGFTSDTGRKPLE